MRILSREELEGVIAHELAHIQHRDILVSTIAATIAGAISYLAQMAQWAAIFGGGRDGREQGIQSNRSPCHDDRRSHCGHDGADGNIPIEGVRSRSRWEPRSRVIRYPLQGPLENCTRHPKRFQWKPILQHHTCLSLIPFQAVAY